MDYKDYLNTTVLQEKKPVTYRSLARNLNIHVNTAKQALYQYSLGHRDVAVIYCLSGTLVDNTYSIRLVDKDDLEETKKEYRQLSGVHVYSLLPCKSKDLSVLVTVHKDMPTVSVEDRVKNGLILNNSVSTIKHGSKTATITTSTLTSAPKPSSTISSTPSKDISTKPDSKKKPVSTKTTATTSHTPAKRKGTLSFEKAAPKSKKQTVEKKKSPSPPPSTSRKVRSIQISEDEESEDEEALDARLARSARIHANDIFSDDDDDDDVVAGTGTGTVDADEKMTTTTEHDDDDHSMKTASPPRDIDDTEDIKSKDNSESVKEDQEEEEEQETVPGKIRRKVLKKKTYKNERGFLVTEDVWEWEQVDVEEPAPTTTTTTTTKTKTAAAKAKTTPSTPAKKSATTKKAPGEQKSLLSFWGKR